MARQKRSFYFWLMTQRNETGADEIAQFANNAFFDQAFPKQSHNYEELSNYLELNAGYLPEMSIFDTAYREYLDQDTI